MTKKLLTILQDKCKDFGLSEKALEDLANSIIIEEGVDDAELEKKADSLAPFAKLMQAEVTRKTQQRKATFQQAEPRKVEESNTLDEIGEPLWFKAYKEQNEARLQALKSENDAFKAEKAKAERGALISSKAKELGIPDFLMKRIHLNDDADIEKELTEYKQDLVTNNLMPEKQADILTSSQDAAKDEAKLWANKLPNNY